MLTVPKVEVTFTPSGKAQFSVDGGTPRPYALSFTYLGKSGYGRKAIETLLKDAFKVAYAQRNQTK